jgi:hypothetical protein
VTKDDNNKHHETTKRKEDETNRGTKRQLANYAAHATTVTPIARVFALH